MGTEVKDVAFMCTWLFQFALVKLDKLAKAGWLVADVCSKLIFLDRTGEYVV